MSLSREEALFRAAVELPPGVARGAFLDCECTGDPALRQRLDALLAAQDEPDKLIATHAGVARPTLKVKFAEEQPDEAVGQTIGRYKLLERVGEGGCGVVEESLMTLPVAGVLLAIGVIRARNSLAAGRRLCSGFGLLILGFIALGVAAFFGTLLSAKLGGQTPQSMSLLELARFAGSCVVPVFLISPGLRLWTDWTRGWRIRWCVLILAFPVAALLLHGFLVAIGFLAVDA